MMVLEEIASENGIILQLEGDSTTIKVHAKLFEIRKVGHYHVTLDNLIT